MDNCGCWSGPTHDSEHVYKISKHFGELDKKKVDSDTLLMLPKNQQQIGPKQLNCDQKIYSGSDHSNDQLLASENGRFRFIMQGDGNLVLYDLLLGW